jgi:hypothetical protein
VDRLSGDDIYQLFAMADDEKIFHGYPQRRIHSFILLFGISDVSDCESVGQKTDGRRENPAYRGQRFLNLEVGRRNSFFRPLNS